MAAFTVESFLDQIDNALNGALLDGYSSLSAALAR